MHSLDSVASDWPRLLTLLFAFLSLLSSTAAQQSATSQASTYAPKIGQCPSRRLDRAATDLSRDETAFVSSRRQRAATKLQSWLASVDPDLRFDRAPTIALTTSGGGYRSMLLGGGLVSAMDEREASKGPLSGLYQSFVYHGGLSGGSWLLSSIAGNGFAKVSEVSKSLWEPALEANILYPTHTAPETVMAAVEADLLAKQDAGFPPTTPEVWGRYLGYQLLSGPDGGVSKTMSSIARDSAFAAKDVPFPIITALGVRNINGSVCDAADNATTYEFTPYEFGSWDKGVQAFVPTEYMGTRANRDGILQNCVTGFDNLGLILGASSAKFNEQCGESLISVIAGSLTPLIEKVHKLARRDLFIPVPNPFQYRRSSTLVRNDKELYLVDGGQALQNNPIWPFLQPARGIDVIVVNDNSADTDDNWPNGTEIQRTYTRSLEEGLTRMPFIPAPEVFVSKSLNKNATFFGCDDPSKVFIVFLPNWSWNVFPGFDSNKASSQFDYERNDTQRMISVGRQGIATQGGDKEWPKCLGCALISRSSKSLPASCKACFDRYCYRK